MITVEDIEKAIARLPAAELAQFRAWFDSFDAARCDERIEGDAKDGKLDAFAARALEAHRNGGSRQL